MAIKITKPGQKEFHGFCNWCGCEFTYEISDLKLSATGDKLDCPTCGKDYHHPSRNKSGPVPLELPNITWPPEPIPCIEPNTTQTDLCAGCSWKEYLKQGGIYVGDTPCTWCTKNRFNVITAQPSINDYITLCGVKSQEAHLTTKECNCGPNAVCSKCSGTSGTISATNDGISQGIATKQQGKTTNTVDCLCNGDVWRAIEDCCINCIGECNQSGDSTNA